MKSFGDESLAERNGDEGTSVSVSAMEGEEWLVSGKARG